MYFSNRKSRNIWVKSFEGADRRKVHQIFPLLLSPERHLFLASDI